MSNFMKSIVAEVLERNHPAAPALISVVSPVTVAPLVTVTSPVTVPIPAPALASVFAPAPASVSSATATPAASAAPATTAASAAPAPGATAAAAAASSAPASASASPSCSAGSRADCLDTCSSPRDCPQPPGGIKRVNYQREQAGKRLALLGLPGASPTPVRLPDNAAQLNNRHLPQELPAASTATGRSPAVNEPGDHRSFAERYLSPLLLRTLPTGSVHSSGGWQSSGSGQASIPVGAQHSGKNSAGDIPCRPGIPGAGATQIKDSAGITYSRNTASPDTPFPLIRDGTMDAWLFPVISSRLRGVLGTAGRSCSSAGILSVPVCHPGQLFAAEELLGSDPALEADIQWGASGGSFELRLFSNDSAKLDRLLTELTGILQRDSARRVRVYTSLQPGPLLRRHLAAGQQEAIAVIDAASRWSSIGLAEQLLGGCPDAGLSLRAERSYCIISGTSAQLASVLPGLTRFADQ
ncbi:hypothetical protein NYE33_08950 [Paenibacillus sp. FSL R10-2199]|uniref:hypothetical protein n=1 Tax=Paenibacillus sp. FSL R10-2199 TaxID=2975348 RepID=UPI0030FB3E9B